MKKLVVIVSLMLASTLGFSQDTPVKASASVDTEVTIAKTDIKEVSKDTTVAFVTSKKALIEADFDKSIFLFRTKKSKKTQLC